MRYFVTVSGRTWEIDLSGTEALVDGQPVSADLRAVHGTGLRHMLVDGESFPLVLNPGDGRGEWHVHIDGRRFAVEVLDERARAIREMTGQGAAPRGPKPVRAPMPGLVVRVEVEPGQVVRPGQGIVIVEAMKMENELRTEAGGVVARIHVAAGQAVEKGAVLVEFAAD